MVRPLRLEYPGALWHVQNRGVEQRAIFLNDADRRNFLEILAVAIDRFRWQLYAYVLMSNHFHLFLQTPETTLSRGMQLLEGDHAEEFNLIHDRVGHLFQGRFKSQLVDTETYLLEVARYIVLNPVRAKLVPGPEKWTWSSYRATAGLEEVPAWLDVDTLLREFHPTDREEACRLYQVFVSDGITQTASPWRNLVAQTYLGSPKFLIEVQKKLRTRNLSSEYPSDQRKLSLVSLEQVQACVANELGVPLGRASRRNATARLAFALVARNDALTTLPQIGKLLGVSAAGALYLVRSAQRRCDRDPEFSERVAAIRRQLDHLKLQM